MMCYKVVIGLVTLSFALVTLSFADFFAFSPVTVTRGHQYKLYVNHSRGVRKHFFAEDVVALCNSLADTDFSSLNSFKRNISTVDVSKFLVVEISSCFRCVLQAFLFVFYFVYYFKANVSAIH